jgi:hypothetical protein
LKLQMKMTKHLVLGGNMDKQEKKTLPKRQKQPGLVIFGGMNPAKT